MSTTEALETRERVLSAAGPVFAAKGFKDATVREICQRAGVNIAAVNYHFGDKQRLYIETVKRAHQARAEQVPLPTWPAGSPAERKLYDFIRTLLVRVLDDPAGEWHGALMLREMAQPSGACVELVRDYIRPHFELLLSILDELLPASTASSDRHLVAFSIVGQCLHYRVAQPIVKLLVSADEFHSYQPELLATHIHGLTLAALGREPAVAGRGAV